MRRLRAGLLLCAVSTILPVEGADPIPEVARLLTRTDPRQHQQSARQRGQARRVPDSQIHTLGFEIDIIPTPSPARRTSSPA